MGKEPMNGQRRKLLFYSGTALASSLVSSAKAQMIPFSFWKKSDLPAATFTYTGNWVSAASDLTTVTSTAIPIGAAPGSGIRRVVAIIQGGWLNKTKTLTSVTIGGVAATIHYNPCATAFSVSIVASALVPTGTTAVVTAVFSSGAHGRYNISLYTLNNRTTQYVTTVTTVGSTAAVNLALNVPADQHGIVASYNLLSTAATTPVTWTNATEVNETSGAGWYSWYGAGVATATGNSTRTSTMSYPAFGGYDHVVIGTCFKDA